MTVLLEANKLLKSYPGVIAVNNASIEINEKDFIGICGNSGSGKSTLMHCMATFERLDSGEIKFLFEGELKNVFDYLIFYRQSFVGFVFQFFHLLPTLTILENVMLPLELEKSPFAHESRSRRKERAMATLKLFKVDDIYNKGIQQVSGGQLQRVAFARCVVTEPKIILADEPTGNLDQKNRTLIYEFLRAQVFEYNRSVVMVTHDEESAAQYCTKIYQMKDGCLEKK